MNDLPENDVLKFPIQIKDWEEPMTDKELVFQARFFAAKALNQYNIGLIDELPEHIKENIHKVNEYCRKVGLTPLEGNF